MNLPVRIAGIVLGASALLVLAAPFWRRRRLVASATQTGTDAARRARATATGSTFAAAATLAWATDWSFRFGVLNTAAMLLAFCGAGMAVAFALSLAPRRTWRTAALAGAAAWLVGALVVGGDAVFAGASPAWVDLGAGLACRATTYSYTASDSGSDLDVFRRFALFDHRIYHQRQPKVYPVAPAPAPVELRVPLRRCNAMLQAQRRRQAAVANGINRAYTPAVAASPFDGGKR